MPGNEFGDRVHNFFAQESSLQGLHQSQVLEGNWTALNDNYWVGNQRQADLLNLNGKNYNLQDSADIDRRQGGYPFHPTQGLNFTQSNLRAEFGKSHPQNDQPNLNGYMYGNQFHPTGQNEVNFLASDSDSKQHQLSTSRSLSGHVAQQGIATEHQAKTSETSVPSGGFDLFGCQQQMSHQPSMLLPTQHQHQHQHQHPGMNKVQHQQNQLMIRKMQDLQRLQQFQQLDLRQQNMINQIPTFSKQASGSHSSNLINGNTVSGSLQYPWATDIGTNWLNHDSSAMQGSPSGMVFPPNLGQTQHLVDLIPQQVDQSLYGVPVSSSRGLPQNQYSHKVTDRSSMQAVDNLHGNRIYLPDQAGVQDRTSIYSQKLENMFENASSQSLNTETLNNGGVQQVGSFQGNAPQDFLGRQELTTGSDIPNEKSARQVVTPNNETSLDPAEEKILFGSDDNIWAAFGTGHNMIGNMFDNTDLNGFPSIQSGSWSALMQSAVAESSRCDVGPRVEWSGLMINNVDGSSVNHPSTCNDNATKQSLVDNDMQLHASSSPASLPLANDAVGLNRLEHKFLNEPDHRTPNEMSHRFVTLEESSKWSNYGALQKSVAEGIQMYVSTSQLSLEAERNSGKISSPWVHGHTVAQQQSDGRNSLAASVPSVSNRLFNAHKDEGLSRNFQNNQMSVIQSSTEVNKVTLSLNDNSPVANSSSVGGGGEGGPFVQNNLIHNQWKNMDCSGISQGGETLGRMLPQAIEHNQGLDTMNACDKNGVTSHEMENSGVKENCNDSHRSNLSWNVSGGFKETGLSNSNDSRSLPLVKQKSGNQLSRKVATRKFQYHPMGNLDEDVETSYGINQPNNVQVMTQQNPHFDHSNSLVQFPRNSKGQTSDLQKHKKVSNEEPLHGVAVASHALNKVAPFSRHFDLHTQDKAFSSGQNMLELLPKVDQSRGHVAMMPLSSECNVPAKLPETENYDGSAYNYQQSQLSVNQGFGLQLGPPSQQRIQNQDSVNLMSKSHTATESGEKERQMIPTSLDQSSSLPNFEYQSDLYNKGSAFSLPHHSGDEKMHEGFLPTLSSGSPRINVYQSQPVNVLNGKMVNSRIDSSFSSIQRGSADTLLPDAHGHVEKSNPVKSHDGSQQSSPNDSHQRDPSPVLSARDSVHNSPHFDVYNSSHPGSSINLFQNTGTTGSARQHGGIQYQKVQSPVSRLSSELNQPNIVESSSFSLPENDMNACKRSNAPIGSPVGDGKEQRFNEGSGLLPPPVKQDPVSKLTDTFAKASKQNSSDNSPVTMSLTNIQIDSFGQSLKPNAAFHQNLGSSNHGNDVKDAETDPSIRVSKRMKGPDYVSNVDVVPSLRGKTAKDSLSSSGYVHSQEIMAQDVNAHCSNSSTEHTSYSRADYPEVSPQMAPSWFNQYGTFENCQMLHQYDAHKISTRPGELPFTIGKSLDATDLISSEKKGTDDPTNDACQVGTKQASIPTDVTYDDSSSRSSKLNTSSQELMILSTKKRKSDTSDLLPWHKNILDFSQNLWALSVAEANWNKVNSCLAEKIDYDAEFIEDGPPSLKSKRRLILTTQLMQLLFLPPPANILSSDASSKYESIACAVSRTVLGDVCNMVSRFSGVKLPSVKDNFSAEVMEELMGRSLKLENDLLRLDKNSSVFDLGMECQDLDKFSVINRLAKFHGRAHSESAETASTPKPLPQRYVTALPMPRNLPDRVQCLSL